MTKRRIGLHFFLLTLALLLTGFLLPGIAGAQAILNVENLQGEEREGARGQISVRVNLAEGNTEIFQLGGSLGGGVLTERHWIRAFAGMDRLEDDGREILDNRYLHLRYNYRFSPGLRTFHFFQLQTNQNLFLERRLLLGSGLRYRLADGDRASLDVGSGPMVEWERLDAERLEAGEGRKTETLRWTNLLVGSGLLGEGSRWTAMAYYQPSVEDMADFRLLGEIGLGVPITGSLELDVALNWRHDSRAPKGLKEDDLALRTGFTLRSR